MARPITSSALGASACRTLKKNIVVDSSGVQSPCLRRNSMAFEPSGRDFLTTRAVCLQAVRAENQLRFQSSHASVVFFCFPKKTKQEFGLSRSGGCSPRPRRLVGCTVKTPETWSSRRCHSAGTARRDAVTS